MEDLKEWGRGLSPETLTIDIDSYSAELEEVYEDNKSPSIMRFSYGDLDDFIRRSNYIGHAITVHYARLERLLAKSKRAAANRKAALLKNFTDKCLATIPGKPKANGTITADKAPIGVSKYSQDYFSFAYLSDEVWHSLEEECEKYQEMLRIVENQKKTHENRLYQITQMLDERKRLK